MCLLETEFPIGHQVGAGRGLEEAVSGERAGTGVAGTAVLATCCSVLCTRYCIRFISPHHFLGEETEA